MSVFGMKKTEDQPGRPEGAQTGGSGHPSSLIGRTLFVKGEVVSEDDVIIDGHVDGKIMVKNRLTVGKNAVIKSEIEASVVVIEGKVQGDVKGKIRVEIVPGGALSGNITSPKVVIADGGFFEGNVDMKGREEKDSAAAGHGQGGAEKESRDHSAQAAKTIKK